ncbi:MAG: DMT family protein [Bacteroidaceae bacterium]|nr:DMT family protein [Bacteroidaceae bacterium]
MRALGTILLLLVSNTFMTFAWYGNLKLQELKISTDWPLFLIILASWGLAFFEYCFMIPANRVGSDINGGPFNLVQLKVIQECVSLVVFTLIVTLVFKGQQFHWNHLCSFVFLVLAVFFAFLK